MKINKTFKILLIALFILTMFSTSYSLGITIPSQSKFYFKPNLEFDIPFRILNNGNSQFVDVTMDGDLKQYSAVSEDRFWVEAKSGHNINLVTKLPAELEPGTHSISIIATEAGTDREVENGVSARTAVRHNIQVYVPYPNDYMTLRNRMLEMEKNNPCLFSANIQNLGNNDNTAYITIEVIDENNKTVLKSSPEESSFFIQKSADKEVTLKIKDCENLKPGIYKVNTYYDFAGIKKIMSSELRVGSFDVIILNYTNTIQSGEINKFSIKLKSQWNAIINNIYFKLYIMNGTKVMTSSEIAPFNLDKWETVEKNIFIDAPAGNGNYNAKIELYYESTSGTKKIEKEFNIVVQKKKLNILGYAIFGTSSMIPIAMIIVIIFIGYFIYRKNTKTNDEKSFKNIKPKSKK